MENIELKNLKTFARSWNNLDTQILAQHLASDVSYFSQWTGAALCGNDTLLSYLQEKFEQLKSAMLTELITLSAELAIHPGINNRQCIILKQMSAEGVTLVMLLITCYEDKISRIDACYVPEQNELIMTGEFPK